MASSIRIIGLTTGIVPKWQLRLIKTGIFQRLTDEAEFFQQGVSCCDHSSGKHLSVLLSCNNCDFQALTCLRLVFPAAERLSLFLSAGMNQHIGILLPCQCQQQTAATAASQNIKDKHSQTFWQQESEIFPEQRVDDELGRSFKTSLLKQNCPEVKLLHRPPIISLWLWYLSSHHFLSVLQQRCQSHPLWHNDFLAASVVQTENLHLGAGILPKTSSVYPRKISAGTWDLYLVCSGVFTYWRISYWNKNCVYMHFSDHLTISFPQ